MSVSKEFVLSGKVNLVVSRPHFADQHWLVERVEPTGNFRTSAWFAKLQVEGRWLYAGKLDIFTGQVGTTAKSAVKSDDARLVCLNRILARVWAGDHKAYTQHGFDINAEGQEQVPDDGTRGALQYIADSFVVAIGRGLKRPMIRCHFRDQRFKLYLSSKGTICLKSGHLASEVAIGAVESFDGKTTYKFADGGTSDKNLRFTHDPVGDEFYVGCLLRGEFLPAQLGRREDEDRPIRQLTATEAAFLDGLRADPAGFLAQCSKDMNRCCYCNQPLEDARSKAVGYGQTCSKRWCLPWGNAKADEVTPSFAQLHDSNAAGLCDAIRKDPTDETAWAIFSDWLEERGLPRLEVPARQVAMPRN